MFEPTMFDGPTIRGLIAERDGRRGSVVDLSWSYGFGSALIRRMANGLDSANEGECWLWTRGSRNRSGYGVVTFDGRGRAAHRIAYELVNGPIPSGLLVCHACDTPACVNPEHLHVGTHADNARECTERGRRKTKLSVEQAAEILASTAKERELASTYGVSHTTINRIRNGKRRSLELYRDKLRELAAQQ